MKYLLRNIGFQCRHVQVMNRFRRFTTGAIDPFNLISNVSIVILFSQLRG